MRSISYCLANNSKWCLQCRERLRSNLSCYPHHLERAFIHALTCTCAHARSRSFAFSFAHSYTCTHSSLSLLCTHTRAHARMHTCTCRRRRCLQLLLLDSTRIELLLACWLCRFVTCVCVCVQSNTVDAVSLAESMLVEMPSICSCKQQGCFATEKLRHSRQIQVRVDETANNLLATSSRGCIDLLVMARAPSSQAPLRS